MRLSIQVDIGLIASRKAFLCCSREQLLNAANHLDVRGCTRLRKAEIVARILLLPCRKVLQAQRMLGISPSDDVVQFIRSFWARFHNHIYGVAGIIALAVSLVTLLMKLLK